MRWPYVKISGLAPARPTNGLSGGTRAVIANAQSFADVVAQALRLHAQAVVLGARAAEPVAIADGDVQRLVGAEQNLAADVAAVLPRVGDEDVLHVAQLAAVEAAARDGERRALPLGAAFRVRQVHQLIRREARVQRDPLEVVVRGDTGGRPHRVGGERAAAGSDEFGRAPRRASSCPRAASRCSTDAASPPRP